VERQLPGIELRERGEKLEEKWSQERGHDRRKRKYKLLRLALQGRPRDGRPAGHYALSRPDNQAKEEGETLRSCGKKLERERSSNSAKRTNRLNEQAADKTHARSDRWSKPSKLWVEEPTRKVISSGKQKGLARNGEEEKRQGTAIETGAPAARVGHAPVLQRSCAEEVRNRWKLAVLPGKTQGSGPSTR